jgi:hypothetical protein
LHSDREDGIEVRTRVLHDYADVPSSEIPEFFFVEGAQISAEDVYTAAQDVSRPWDVVHQRSYENRLARPTLADDPENLAPPNVE